MASPEKLKEIKDDYLSSLSDLTINSKPLINMLTMLAEDNIDNAVTIVQAIEEHLAKVRGEYKLPVLYLIDSIVKNVGNAYTTLFTQNIVSNFCGVFEKVDERIRAHMFKLRQTWSEVFPPKKLYALDVRVNNIDPAWPIIAPTPTPSIHVNPKFFNKSAAATTTATPTAVASATAAVSTASTTLVPSISTLDPKSLDMLLIAKQKQLIELQQRKVELELLQAKVKLEEQQKKQLQTTSQPKGTTTSVVLPSMKAILTKPTALPVEVKSAETKPVAVTKPSPVKVMSQVVPPAFVPKVSNSTTPRIAPVNSALVAASVKATPRDPRLASKRARSKLGAPDVVVDDEPTKASGGASVVADRRQTKHKSNRVASDSTGCASSNNDNNAMDKAVFSKIGASQNNASSAKDPRLVSNKVHGPTPPTTTDVPGRRAKRKQASARPKGAAAAASVQPLRRPRPSGGRSQDVVVVATVTDGSSDDVHRPTSRSSVKPKRKESRGDRADAKRGAADRAKNNAAATSTMMMMPPTTTPPSLLSMPTLEPPPQRDVGKARSRERSRRERTPEQRRDVDLRVGAPPEKQPRVRSPPDEESAKTHQVIDTNTASKDVDLRQLPPPVTTAPTSTAAAGKKRTSNDGTEQPSAKKNKAEIFDALFGNEDVDLRTMTTAPPPPRPPTPPPPIISSPATPGIDDKDNGGWAKVKETKSPITPGPNTHLATVRAKLAKATNRDRLGRPLLYNRTPEESIFRRGFEPKISDDASLKVILHQAEEEHKNGKISSFQFQILMQQVIRLIETQKLHEAQRKEAKFSGSTVDGNLQPISDDELSVDFSEDDDDGDGKTTTTTSSNDEAVVRDALVASPVVVSKPVENRPSTPPKSETRSESPPPRAFQDGAQFQTRVAETTTTTRTRKPRNRPLTRRWDAPVVPPPIWEPPRPPIVVTLPSQTPVPRPSIWTRPTVNSVDDKEQQQRFNTAAWQQPGGAFALPRLPLIRPTVPTSAASLVDARPNVATGGFVRNPPAPHYDPSASPPAIGCHATRELPQADPSVLDYINDDVMKTINIDGVPREIRYYGETAIVIMSWDDPREISFQAGQRRVTFDEKESYLLSFNDTYCDVMIAGSPHKIRLGGPTRELYIDDKWYECFFGGPGIGVEIDGKIRVVKMEGPPPQVKIGTAKRTDLCAGRINLIVDARTMVPIFLDAKPQKFDIEGKIHTLRFVDALKTVLINEVPFKVEFGGLPKPIKVHDKKHFIRFSVLPRGVVPGHVDIKDMEGRKVVAVVSSSSPPPPRIEPDVLSSSVTTTTTPTVTATETPASVGEQTVTPQQPAPIEVAPIVDTNEPVLPMVGKRRPPAIDIGENRSNSPTLSTIQKAAVQAKNFGEISGLDILSSLIPTAMAPSSNINSSGYEVEHMEPAAAPTTVQTAGATIPGLDAVPRAAPIVGLPSTIDIDDLFRKLVATGIVSNLIETKPIKETKTEESKNAMKTVLFEKPETLKVKQPTLVTALYSGMQCSSCGVRFPPEHTMKYSQHLDWHFRQNRRERHSVRKANSRKWFYDVSDWIQFEEIEDLEEREKNWFESQQLANAAGETVVGEEPNEEIEVPSVDAGGAGQNARCDVCHDSFDQFYNEDKEEWHLKMAMRVDGKLYHPLCYEDYTKASIDDASRTDTSLNESTDAKPKSEDEEPDAAEPEPVDAEQTPVDAKPDRPDDDDDVDVAPTGESVERVDTSDVEIIEEEPSKPEDLTGEDADVSDVIEVNEKEIESITLVDDDEDGGPLPPPAAVDVVKNEPLVFDLTAVKTEPVDPDTSEEYPLIDDDNALQNSFKSEANERDMETHAPAADTTRAAVVSSIDGNVQMEASSAPAVSVPGGRIKINISKPISTQQRDVDRSEHQQQQQSSSSSSIDRQDASAGDASQPGDEPPKHIKLKPTLEGRALQVLEPVQKGTELSGLCSIM